MAASIRDAVERRRGAPPAARAPATGFHVVSALVLMLALPLLVYYLWMSLAFNDGKPLLPSAQMLQNIPLPTLPSLGIVVGWLLFQALLQQVAPGRWCEGAPLADGWRLRYRMNGWSAWWLTWAALALGLVLSLFSPTVLADQLGPLLTTANLFAFAFSFFLYWHGRRTATAREPVGRNPVYDFWLGTARNPRLGSFDLKHFFETRPGLMAWVAIDLSFAAKQLALNGSITTPMILVCLFHLWYVADCLLHEEAILTTWDIRHENLGWMLCWGNLVWVPFTYTIQAQYLLTHTHDLPWWGTLAIVLINLAGYVIFRGANLQKHAFRRDPRRPVWGRPAAFIETAHGSRLLVSGWWGLARHMNYLGDWLMGLAWCLPCLFASLLPYFYVVYLTILLVHRERRDHASCALRYGKDWDAYCARVRSRIIPGVY